MSPLRLSLALLTFLGVASMGKLQVLESLSSTRQLSFFDRLFAKSEEEGKLVEIVSPSARFADNAAEERHILQTDDVQCGSDVCHPPYTECKQIIESTLECVHKPLLPMYTIEITGIVVLSILMMLCTVAGIGGGGVVVPLLSVFFTFSFKEATAISGFSILLCSITRYIYNRN